MKFSYVPFLLLTLLVGGVTFLSSQSAVARRPQAVPSPTVSDSLIFNKGPFQWHEANPCPSQGTATEPKKIVVNRLKNRDKEPPSYQTVTIPQILSEFPTTGITHNGIAHSLENVGARVEGFLVKVKKQGTESCNCGSVIDTDYHIFIVATKAEAIANDRSHALVVETSPRTLKQHSETWKQSTLNSLATQKAKVAISGWLLFDPEHPDQIGQTRGTLWEVHPIHKIEVFTNNQWVTL